MIPVATRARPPLQHPVLLRQQVRLIGEFGGVGHDLELRPATVRPPQAGQRVGDCAGPQEEDRAAVVGDLHLVRHPESQPAGCGVDVEEVRYGSHRSIISAASVAGPSGPGRCGE